MIVTDRAQVLAFLDFVDALRVRGVLCFKCDTFEVTLNPYGGVEYPDLPEEEELEEDADLLFYSAK